MGFALDRVACKKGTPLCFTLFSCEEMFSLQGKDQFYSFQRTWYVLTILTASDITFRLLKLGCGWVFLKLFDASGIPIPEK